MELEKAKKECNSAIKCIRSDFRYEDTEDNFILAEAIETVIKELKYKDEQIEKLYNDCKELEDYKDKYEKGNLIPKKKIEDKIKDCIDMRNNYEKRSHSDEFSIRMPALQAVDNYTNKIEVLQELLEVKK